MDKSRLTELYQRIPTVRRQVPEQVLGIQSLEGILRELPAAFSGVDLFAGELLELLHSYHDGPAVPVCRQQVAGASSRNINAVPPIPPAGGEETVKLSGGLVDDLTSNLWNICNDARLKKEPGCVLLEALPLALRAEIGYNKSAGRVCYG